MIPERRSELEDVVRRLKDRGYRMTPQRILLTKLILETVERHPSLKELAEMSQSMLPGVGISTIYNTIMMLESLGVIKVFYLNGKLYIDRARPHVNVVCRDTEEIVDVDGGTLEKIINIMSSRQASVKNPMVLIIGECGERREQEP